MEETTQSVVDAHQGELDRLTVLFPNARSQGFFRKHLLARVPPSSWLPSLMTLDEWVFSWCAMSRVSDLEATAKLYSLYLEHSKRTGNQDPEKFEGFLPLGRTLLNDFEDIDQSGSDPDHLLLNVADLESLNERFPYLSERDLEIVKKFWKTTSDFQRGNRTLQMWKLFLGLYHGFRSWAVEHRTGYRGTIYSLFLERVEQWDLSDKHFAFVGFNALTGLEESIFKWFVQKGKGSVYWDVDSYYMGKGNFEAGRILKKYRRDPILGGTFPSPLPERIGGRGDIRITAATRWVGQVKALVHDLLALSSSDGFEPSDCLIVLPEDVGILPLVRSLPDRFSKVNISTRYPLRRTPLYQLFSLLSNANVEYEKRNKASVAEIILEVVKNPCFIQFQPLPDSKTLDDLRKSLGGMRTQGPPASGFIGGCFQKFLPKFTPLGFLFSFQPDPFKYFDSVIKGILQQKSFFHKQHQRDTLEQMSQKLEEIQRIGSKFDIELDHGFIHSQMDSIFGSISAPIGGGDLDSLHILSIPETRNLDFKYVFILNVNENSWPPSQSYSTFIPPAIRQVFGLRTGEDRDVIYAYLFYRLLHRAHTVWIYYNSITDSKQRVGEKSRFVQQLEMEFPIPPLSGSVSNPLLVDHPASITIKRDADILEALQEYLLPQDAEGSRPSRSFSPSALIEYLDCRLKFYFHNVLGLREQQQVRTEESPSLFGTLFHEIMKDLYGNNLDEILRFVESADPSGSMVRLVEGVVEKCANRRMGFAGGKSPSAGYRLIVTHVLCEVVRQVVSKDLSNRVPEIRSLEKRHSALFRFPLQGKEERAELAGWIDRVDRVGQTMRIIDYKTGKVRRDFPSIRSLFDREHTNRNKSVFQVFLYCMIVAQQPPGESGEPIQPVLYSTKNAFGDDFGLPIEMREPRSRQGVEVLDFRVFQEEFSKELAGLICEIFDPSQPFDQTTDLKTCGYCPYATICRRG